MSDLGWFLLLLPVYAAAVLAGAAMMVVLLVGAVVYVPAMLVWSLVTGRDLGPGW